MNDERPPCIGCRIRDKEIADLKASHAKERERLLKAIRRESEQWDRRAHHSGRRD